MSVALPALEPRREGAAPVEWSRLSAAVAVAAAALFGASVAVTQVAGRGHGSAAPVTPFGGTTAVVVPATGGIEHALGPARDGRVLRVPCAGSTATSPTGCFTALP